MKKNLRGAYLNFAHDRSEDWNWLRDWQPSVVRLMLPGSHTDPNSVDVQRIRRVHETAPDALIVLRVWDVDDRNHEAHMAMVANPVAEAGKQLDWWARVFDRVTVPRGRLIAGLNNEVNPHQMGAPLYAYTERACLLGTQREIRLGCGVFSVGNPGKTGEGPFDMAYFARLEDAMLSGDHVWIVHEYMQPEGMYAVWTDDEGHERRDFGNLINRHTYWPSKRVKKIIGEWGVDGLLFGRHPHPQYGNSGWKNFPELWTPERYADEYVACCKVADESVIAICPFMSDNPDQTGRWWSFDVLPAYGELLERKQACEIEVQPSTPSTVYIPVVGGPVLPTPTGPVAIVITPAGANIRSGPGLDYAVLGTEPQGAQMAVDGRATAEDGVIWWRVDMLHTMGWVSDAVVTTHNTGDVPMVDALAPKPPAPQPGNNWQRCYAFVRRWEGGWADNPNDPGGATMKGIALATYTRWRQTHGQPAPTRDALRNITDAEVEQIYREWYWQASGADRMKWPLCLAHFDTAVNAGVGRASEMMQKSGGGFLAYMGHLIDWYTRIPNFEHFGKAWIRRRADLLREAAQHDGVGGGP